MSEIAPSLLAWFERCGRKDLPWQQRRSGYRVWLSEIMLQQTQVATVIPYFQRFVNSFPTVVDLADADVDDVLRHWAGLGYYARARNLHKAACIVRDEHQGEFPQSLEQLMKLPGIGRSTAGAILSLAFQQPAAILDGNVKRVLSRVYRIEGWSGQAATLKTLWQVAEQQTPQHRVDAYNQAMMDLGATVCVRSKPACDLCPLTTMCESYAHGSQGDYPQAKPRKTRPLRHTWMLLHHDAGHVLLQRRPPQGIWGGLWSLPELDQLDRLVDWQNRYLGQAVPWQNTFENELRHQFSHFELTISLARIEVPHALVDASGLMVDEETRLHWVPRNQLDAFGLPAPVKRLLQEKNLIQPG